MNSQIIIGDCLEVLKTMPDESVHCVVTSPPYWALRDYGTAKWNGGNNGCDHRHQLGGEGISSSKQNTSAGTQTIAYRDTCAKCGARRIDQQLGLERTPEEYTTNMVEVFKEVRRILRSDGTLWLNMGDSYASNIKSAGRNDTKRMYGAESQHLSKHKNIKTEHGLKPKDLCGIPWRLAFALQADGWWLRSDIIWNKPNCMTESVTDRPTKSHEYVFLLAKSARYYYDGEEIKEPSVYPNDNRKSRSKTGQKTIPTKLISGNRPGSATYPTRNKRTVWTIATKPFKGAHFATFPPDLVEPCIKAGCVEGGTVLDPFGGAGTVGLVANRLGRNAILIELNQEYADMARERIAKDALPLFQAMKGE